MRTFKEIHAFLYRHSSCHFRHRDEQRERTVGTAYGLVSETYGSALNHGLCQRLAACEMQIGEQQLVFTHELVLRLDRLLHFDYHFCFRIDFLDCRNHLCAYFCEILVGESAAFACGFLNKDSVSVFYEFVYSCRGHCHAVLIVLNLFWNSNYHSS